jgi:hypothetical protein
MRVYSDLDMLSESNVSEHIVSEDHQNSDSFIKDGESTINANNLINPMSIS